MTAAETYAARIDAVRAQRVRLHDAHAPRSHSLRLAGSPSAAWKAVSLKTIMRPSTWPISH